MYLNNKVVKFTREKIVIKVLKLLIRCFGSYNKFYRDSHNQMDSIVFQESFCHIVIFQVLEFYQMFEPET